MSIAENKCMDKIPEAETETRLDSTALRQHAM